MNDACAVVLNVHRRPEILTFPGRLDLERGPLRRGRLACGLLAGDPDARLRGPPGGPGRARTIPRYVTAKATSASFDSWSLAGRDVSLDRLRRLDKCVRRVPIAVAFEEDLGADNTLFIEDERPWVRHAFGLAFGGLVEDVVILDRLAAGIRQEEEGDLRLVGELFENRRLVVADPDDLDSGFLDRLEITLQLDQLRTAEGSPVGRAVEHQGDLALFQRFHPAIALCPPDP